MPAFTDLTTDEQGQLKAFMPMFRVAIGELARVCNHGASLDGIWLANVKAIVAKLDAATVVPDDTGLAGAAQVTSDDLNSTMGLLEALLASANTQAQRAEYIKIAGAPNTVG